MIYAEVGLNHNGDANYADEYVNFHKENDFSGLSFQIREPKFYLREEKKHLKLPKSFYDSLFHKYEDLKGKLIGLALASLDTFNDLKDIKFDYYKILSIAAKDEILIENLLKKTDSKIFISCGLLNKKDLDFIIKKYIKNARVKFIYTQLSYDAKNLNLINLFNLFNKYNSKIAYGHHYTNELPIIISQVMNNLDLFIYLKGNKKIIHPDEEHAFNFDQFNKLLKQLNEEKEILGNKDVLFADNDISI